MEWKTYDTLVSMYNKFYIDDDVDLASWKTLMLAAIQCIEEYDYEDSPDPDDGEDNIIEEPIKLKAVAGGKK